MVRAKANRKLSFPYSIMLNRILDLPEIVIKVGKTPLNNRFIKKKSIFFSKHFADLKKRSTFASQSRNKHSD